MLADDTTLILKDKRSIELAINEFEKFSKSSGLKLYLQKTEIIPIGSNIYLHTINNNIIGKIKVKNGAFKTLGVWFSHSAKEMLDLNFDGKIENIKKLLFIWTARNLSLKGRITIIKSLILPQILFLFTLLYVPNVILKKLNDILFSFLWKFKPPKVKKETIISAIEDGGLTNGRC